MRIVYLTTHAVDTWRAARTFSSPSAKGRTAAPVSQRAYAILSNFQLSEFTIRAGGLGHQLKQALNDLEQFFRAYTAQPLSQAFCR